MVIVGFTNITSGVFIPDTIEYGMNPVLKMWWAASMFVGGLMVLAGSFYYIIRIHLAGLGLVVSGLFMYGLVLFVSDFPSSVFVGIIQLVFSMAFFIRACEIHKQLRRVKKNRSE